ncbi:phage/plasmid primase, P4 family [Trichocoleus sp. Lan]|uniref:phage/plasmid primase, P4 family n=1 Tax=Trichocoleus sp. Lan TaxID=2933927 RepID=UPI00329A0408
MQSTSNTVDPNQAQVLITPFEKQVRSYLEAVGEEDIDPASHEWSISVFDPYTRLRKEFSKFDFEECHRQMVEEHKSINFCLAKWAEEDCQWQRSGQPHRIPHISKNKVSPPEKPKLKNSQAKSQTKQTSKSKSKQAQKAQPKATPTPSVDLVQMLENEVYPKLSLEQVYSWGGHNFQYSSYQVRGNPPFGDSKSGTSFTVFPDSLRFLDAHNGNEPGDPVKYLFSLKVGRYEQPKGRDWIETVKELFALAGVAFPEREWNPEQIKQAQRRETRQTILKAVCDYCAEILWTASGDAERKHLIEERGFTEEGLKDFGIGVYPSVKEVKEVLQAKGLDLEFAQQIGVLSKKWEGYMTFPWANSYGQPLTIYGHQSKKWADETGRPKKYALFNPKDKGFNPKDKGEVWLHTKESPYLLDRVIRDRHKEAVLVEGITDAAIAHLVGDTRVVACVAAMLSKEQVQTLKRQKIERLTISLDPDEAGISGVGSCIKSLLEVGISPYVAPQLPDSLDPDEFILKYGIGVWKEHISAAKHAFTWIAEQIIARGDLSSDSGKESILKQAGSFARTLKRDPSVDLFFWKVIAEALEMDIEAFRKQLEEQFNSEEEEQSTSSKKSKESNSDKGSEEEGFSPSLEQGDLAVLFAEKYRHELAWHLDHKKWYRYGAKQEGIWTEFDDDLVWRLVRSSLSSHSYESKYISGTVRLLKSDLAVETWDETEGLLPLQNGVLNLTTKEFHPHSPENRFTWCLPYHFNILATCDPIQEWLLDMVNGDILLVQLLRAFLNAIVTGRAELQRFLELIGPGGTGKSTLIRLAIALMGLNNTHTTTLQKLEGSRFETASIYGKRLVVITDSERYSGGVSVLKALTGQDTLPYEVKFQQSTGGFTPTAMVIVAANELIQSGDYTSGLERRRLTIPFTKQIPPDQQRNLIEVTNGKLQGEFLPYIPGLLNWVLAMPDEEVTNLVKRTSTQVPSLAGTKASTLIETNPIASWADHCLIYQEGARTAVGVAKRSKKPDDEHQYQNIQTWLYASYCEYSAATGTKLIALQRFVSLTKDLFQSQLKIDVLHKRDNKGAYFLNLKIRNDNDDRDKPRLVSGDLNGDPPPPPPSQRSTLSVPIHNGLDQPLVALPHKSDGLYPESDGMVMDKVTAQTLTCDEPQESDGLSQNLVDNSPDAKKLSDDGAIALTETVSDIREEGSLCESPSLSPKSITGNGLSHHSDHHSSVTEPSPESQEVTDSWGTEDVEAAEIPWQAQVIRDVFQTEKGEFPADFKREIKTEKDSDELNNFSKEGLEEVGHDCSPEEIAAIAQMILDETDGILIMQVMSLFMNASEKAEEEVWKRLTPEERERIETLKAQAQRDAQPGAKCWVKCSDYVWRKATLISVPKFPGTTYWRFELEDELEEVKKDQLIHTHRDSVGSSWWLIA